MSRPEFPLPLGIENREDVPYTPCRAPASRNRYRIPYDNSEPRDQPQKRFRRKQRDNRARGCVPLATDVRNLRRTHFTSRRWTLSAGTVVRSHQRAERLPRQRLRRTQRVPDLCNFQEPGLPPTRFGIIAALPSLPYLFPLPLKQRRSRLFFRCCPARGWK